MVEGVERWRSSWASELVRVLVVEEEDGGGPPGQASRCWTASTSRAQAGPRGEGALGREDVEGTRLGDNEGDGARLGDAREAAREAAPAAERLQSSIEQCIADAKNIAAKRE